MVDILYLSWNRKEFTDLTLRLLDRNTDWGLVNRLVIYDDGSEPAALHALESLISGLEIERVVFRQTLRIGPPGVMLHYLREDPAETFVKIDNDIAVPPGWLEALLRVWDDSPELDLLGMEIGMPRGLSSEPWPEEIEARTWEPCRHIGGVGAMRSWALTAHSPPIRPNGRFGFTEYQHTHKLGSGWIFPEINAPCLDRIPVEPFASWSAEYVKRGWQREWWQYPATADRFWNWMTAEVGA